METPPIVTHHERRALIERHQKQTLVWTDDVAEELTHPVCAECREVWGAEGCSTIRLIVALGASEVRLRANAQRIDELLDAVSPQFAVERLVDREHNRVAMQVAVDSWVLVRARAEGVDKMLNDLAAGLRKWLKDCGEAERLQQDRDYALLLDDAQYRYLSQDFVSPAAAWAYEKPSGTPWPK